MREDWEREGVRPGAELDAKPDAELDAESGTAGDADRDVVMAEVEESALEARLRAEFRQFREPLMLPAGFKERVLARAAAEAGEVSPVQRMALVAERAVTPAERNGRAKVLAFPRAAVWRLVAGGALAASVLAGTFGLEIERRHHEAARVAHEHTVANQQFDEAARITDAALEHTRKQLQRAGVFEDEGR